MLLCILWEGTCVAIGKGKCQFVVENLKSPLNSLPELTHKLGDEGERGNRQGQTKSKFVSQKLMDLIHKFPWIS